MITLIFKLRCLYSKSSLYLSDPRDNIISSERVCLSDVFSVCQYLVFVGVCFTSCRLLDIMWSYWSSSFLSGIALIRSSSWLIVLLNLSNGEIFEVSYWMGCSMLGSAGVKFGFVSISCFCRHCIALLCSSSCASILSNR